MICLCGNNTRFSKNQSAAETYASDNNFVISDVADQGITLESTVVPASADATNSYNLTATVKPTTAIDKTVTWYVEWADSGVTDTVTDYVTVTPESDGSCNATVECKQAFSNQILVGVYVRSNADIKATCTVDYVKKITGYIGNIGADLEIPENSDKAYFVPSTSTGSVLESGSTIPILATATFGQGTVEDKYTIKITYMPEVSYFQAWSTIATVDYSVSVETTEYAEKGYSFMGNYQFTGGKLGVGPWFLLTGTNNSEAWGFANLCSTSAITYLQENPNTAIGTLQVIITGQYSTFNKTYFVYPGDLSAVSTASSVELSTAAIQF
jgi:hypothetical protein